MITSSDNQQIKDARKLQRRRQRERHGQFLIEGLRLVRDAVQSSATIVKLFYAPGIIADNQAAHALVSQCEQSGIPTVACADDLFVTLTETINPQGIAAIANLPTLPLPAHLNFSLILDQVRDPGNAGTLIRTAEAVGVNVVIFGPDTVDPFNDKVVRAGMGAHFRIPIRSCTTWMEVKQLLAPDQVLYLAQANATLPYTAVNWSAPCVLIVGGEADGAGTEATAAAQAITIPMQGGTESLNAAIAGAVILFEAARQRHMDQ